MARRAAAANPRNTRAALPRAPRRAAPRRTPLTRAARAARQVLEALLERWVGSVGKLDPHVRLGLVLSLPFLRSPLRAALAPELARLLACAAEDDDPWVRVIASAVGGVTHTGRLDMGAVLSDVPAVRAGRRGCARALSHRPRVVT